LTSTEINELARKYDVNVDDVLLIGLNTYGVRSAERYPRARVLLRLENRPHETLRMGLPLARDDSPFEARDGQLFLHDYPVARILELEDDDAVLGYLRKASRILVLNSNMRSACTGCVFCPNTLEGASDPKLAVMEELHAYFCVLEAERGWQDLTGLEEVNVVTGCFREETAAITHLDLVRKVLQRHAFGGTLGFLSSVILSEGAMTRIASTLSPFLLVVTLECFSRREVLLKNSKANLRPEAMPGLLASARCAGLETGLTYIVGLEPLELSLEHLLVFQPHLTRFPNFQIFQAHNRFMGRFAAPGADRIEFFLDARRRLESAFWKTNLRPQPWVNYRGLWYFTFAGEELPGPHS